MHDARMDGFDRAILDALQHDGSMTNAELAEVVHLSASQCSRRRAALEAAGIIKGYRAVLDAQRLGFGLRAITRVNLREHGQRNEGSFADFLARQPEVRAAHSVSGDADFIHGELLPHPQVAHVRSDIVLRTMKDDGGLALD
jgi:DNA-binding Lrp family transcriptional regulator